MTYIPRPNPCYLDSCVPQKAKGGRKRWASSDGKRIYEWDSRHGEIEVYNQRGQHLGVVDAENGTLIKDAEAGRRIDV